MWASVPLVSFVRWLILDLLFGVCGLNGSSGGCPGGITGVPSASRVCNGILDIYMGIATSVVSCREKRG